MNKKAIIFTIDALVALSIFIAVTISIYSILTPKPEISIQNSAIYMNSENFLRASDRAENLSQAFEQIQLGNTSNATAIIQGILSELPYPAEMRLNVYDESGNLASTLTVNEQDFGTSIIVRKFLVLTLTENIGKSGQQYVNVNIQSSEPLSEQLTVAVWSEVEAINVRVTPNVYDPDNPQQPLGWSIIPPFQMIEFPPFPPPPQQPPQILMFNVIIPPNAVIGEYKMNVLATNEGNYIHSGYNQFNVIRYGIAELEVGTS